MSEIEVRVPDLGDTKAATVVDVLVSVGAQVRVDDPLITLESEKASMDIPSSAAGTIASIAVKKGQEVSSGAVIATLTTAKSETAEEKAPAAPPTSSAASPAPAAPAAPATEKAPAAAAAAKPSQGATGAAAAPSGALDLVVLGSGPGGYTAAFRAADLGLKVTLIERWPVLGGVCLNVGCIPSKALLHAAKVIEDAADMASAGIVFAPPAVDRERLRAWKNRVVAKLTNGLTVLAKQRKVDVLRGEAKFVGAHTLELQSAEGVPAHRFQAMHHRRGLRGGPVARISG